MLKPSLTSDEIEEAAERVRCGRDDFLDAPPDRLLALRVRIAESELVRAFSGRVELKIGDAKAEELNGASSEKDGERDMINCALSKCLLVELCDLEIAKIYLKVSANSLVVVEV